MPAAPAPRSRRLLWLIGTGILLAALLLALALMQPNPSSPAGPSAVESPGAAQPGASSDADSADASTVPSEQSDALPDLARRIEDDPTAMGAVDAPVVLIEYADLRCPFCGVYARETLPGIVEEYVEDGRVRIEWRDFPVFGDESLAGAIAARAAGEQGRFWEYLEATYAFDGEGHQPLPRERLLELAEEAGVPDLAAFEVALDDSRLRAAVMADAMEAQALGATGTPTFLVGQTPIIGAQPADVFHDAIEAELARAE